MGFKDVILESDSQAIVNLFKGSDSSSTMDKNLVSHIHQLLTRDWRVKVHHIYREANYYVDWFATYSLTKDMGLTIYINPPKGIYHLLKVDAFRVFILRTIVM